MSYYNDNDYRDYLAHHGILGQKWGKKNGPPYPLGYGDHSASEKRAGWRDSLKKDKKVSKEDRRKSRVDFDGYDTYEGRQRSKTRSLSDYLLKEGYIKKNANASKAILKTSINTTAKTDLAVRDRLTGNARILEEDLDTHSYIVSIKPKKGIESIAKITRGSDNGSLDISVYSREGLINQNLNDRAIEKLKKLLE